MNKGMMVAIIAVVAVAAGAGGAFFAAKGIGKASGAEVKEEAPTFNVELEERTVNLSDTNAAHYLKTKVVLEVSTDGEHEAEKGGHGEESGGGVMGEHMPTVMDCTIGILSKQKYADLLTTEGKKHLKEELKEGLNSRLEGSDWTVKDVLFTDFVME